MKKSVKLCLYFFYIYFEQKFFCIALFWIVNRSKSRVLFHIFPRFLSLALPTYSSQHTAVLYRVSLTFPYLTIHSQIVLFRLSFSGLWMIYDRLSFWSYLKVIFVTVIHIEFFNSSYINRRLITCPEYPRIPRCALKAHWQCCLIQCRLKGDHSA